MDSEKILTHLQAALDEIGSPMDSNMAEAIDLIENAMMYFETGEDEYEEEDETL